MESRDGATCENRRVEVAGVKDCQSARSLKSRFRLGVIGSSIAPFSPESSFRTPDCISKSQKENTATACRNNMPRGRSQAKTKSNASEISTKTEQEDSPNTPRDRSQAKTEENKTKSNDSELSTKMEQEDDVMEDVPKAEPRNTTPCVCGGAKSLDELCLMCLTCSRWYHARCLTGLPELKSIPKFVLNYRFVCQFCSDDKSDHFERTMAGWLDVCLTAMLTLTRNAQIDGTNRIGFDGKLEVCDFLDKNWDTVCTGRVRTATWWATVNTTLYVHNKLFKQCRIPVGDQIRLYYELINQDLDTHVVPSQTRAVLGIVTSHYKPVAAETSESLILTTKRRKPETAEETRMRIRERLMLETPEEKKPKKKKPKRQAEDERPLNVAGLRWQPVVDPRRGVILSPFDKYGHSQ